jgi:hypothetical protein
MKSSSIPRFHPNKYSLRVSRLIRRARPAKAFPMPFCAGFAFSVCRNQSELPRRRKLRAVLNLMAGRPGTMLLRVEISMIHPNMTTRPTLNTTMLAALTDVRRKERTWIFDWNFILLLRRIIKRKIPAIRLLIHLF